MAGESRVARGDTYVKKLGWMVVILGLLVAAGDVTQAQMRGLGRINGSIADDGARRSAMPS